MKELLVVDTKNVFYIAANSILAGDECCYESTEAEEISARFMKEVFCIRAEFPKAKIIFAGDSAPYWRVKFISNWYAKHQTEGKEYKADRKKAEWKFVMSKQDFNTLCDKMTVIAARAVGGIVMNVESLEADDIFATIAVTHPKHKVIGYSNDSDWAQLVDERIWVKHSIKDEFLGRKDIRIKWIIGDKSDSIGNVPAYTKAGIQSKNGWGIKTATELLEQHPDDWEETFFREEEKAVLKRNKVLVTLPCPKFDVEEVKELLLDSAVKYEAEPELYLKYGITRAWQDQLLKEGEVAIFRAKMHRRFNEQD